MVEKMQPVEWIEADKSAWGVRVLDMRPMLARGWISVSKTIQESKDACSFGDEDGTAFIDCEPPSPRSLEVDLRYELDARLYDGALYQPTEDKMNQKWAIFVVRGQLVFVWTWKREVRVVADFEQDESGLRVTRARGYFLQEDESEDFTRRALDFLIRVYALHTVYPAPIPELMTDSDPERLAIETIGAFGTGAYYGADEVVISEAPIVPLRSNSLLFFALRRGDVDASRALLDAGLCPDLASREGPRFLVLVAYRGNLELCRLLIERGARADGVHDHNRLQMTPLYHAAASGHLDVCAFLLECGADPNFPVSGVTPFRIAVNRGRHDIAALIRRAGGRS